MSMPTIPDINPDISIKREDAINIIIASIAMEELALSHILNAEGEKLQYVLVTLKGRDPGEITICDIMAVNDSIQKTLRDVIKAEMLLQFKLEDAIELAESGSGCQLTIRGQKIWRDGNNVERTRPANVDISLLRDGEVIKTVTVNSMGDGSFIFECLPVNKNSTQKYTYTVDEMVVPAGYTKTINGFNVINTVEPGVTAIYGTKTWADDNNDGDTRPNEITVNLFQNGDLLTPKQVSKPPVGENKSNFSFDNLPRFDNEGKLFIYSVDENPVAGYEKSIDGFNITNTYKIPY